MQRQPFMLLFSYFTFEETAAPRAAGEVMLLPQLTPERLHLLRVPYVAERSLCHVSDRVIDAGHGVAVRLDQDCIPRRDTAPVGDRVHAAVVSHSVLQAQVRDHPHRQPSPPAGDLY